LYQDYNYKERTRYPIIADLAIVVSTNFGIDKRNGLYYIIKYP